MNIISQHDKDGVESDLSFDNDTIYTQCNEASNLTIICERCKGPFCSGCSVIPPHHLEFMVSTKVTNWFCIPCRPKALKAINTDKLIEDRCAEYMKKTEARITTLEGKADLFATNLDTKADKNDLAVVNAKIDNLQKCFDNLKQKQSSLKVDENLSNVKDKIETLTGQVSQLQTNE